MRLLAYITLASLILTIVQNAVVGLAVLFALMLLWGVLTQPVATLSFMALSLLGVIVRVHPLFCLLALGLLFLLMLAIDFFKSSRKKRDTVAQGDQPRLPYYPTEPGRADPAG